MKKEMNYEFRKKLLEVHREGIRDYSLIEDQSELSINDGCTIFIPEDADRVILTAVKDFQDYLFTSMGISAMIKKGTVQGCGNFITISTGASQTGYCIEITEGINIYAFGSRNAAQALYYLEDLMNLRKAPFLKKGSINREPLFSPRMVHSGYGLDNYPDAHLSAIAHAGMDAILVFVKGIDTTPYGYLDFNELIYRAGKYGIDVYAYSYLISEKHPDDADSKEYYHNLYGKLFEKCPKLKGLVLVGESVEFPSRDKRTTGRRHDVSPHDNIPEGKPNPGWWPCYDYPKWLNLVKNTVRSVKPDADIVFWTYNWGWAPEEDRLCLINSIPTDVSLLVTYEMFEKYKVSDITEMCTDYTLAIPGPGKYFISEAEAAKKRGIKLYAMSNTAGLTWDIGVIPYEPMPYQWIKRFEGLKQAKEKWGLCGLMESHHYGFYPSFISELAKSVFYTNSDSSEECLNSILRKYYTENAIPALKLWSEAITYYTICDEDQYGPFRIGTAYPLCLNKALKPPDNPHAHYGSRIYEAMYKNFDSGRSTLFSIRVQKEIEMLCEMAKLMQKGTEILKNIHNPSDELISLINLGEFIFHCVHTTINTKKWYQLRLKLFSETDRKKLGMIADEMESLALSEIKNAEESIPQVEYDSRLGWEPSMEYMADAEHIRWKIKQVRYVIASELSIYKQKIEE